MLKLSINIQKCFYSNAHWIKRFRYNSYLSFVLDCREKKDLEESVRKLQSGIDSLKESDAHHFSNTLRSRDLAEQNAFEKAQSDIEIRRLRDELDRQHARVREMQHEMAKKIAEERALAERRYNYQVDQLGGDLSSQWEAASRLQLELERQKRIEADYRRDLAQKNSQIDDLRSELKQKTASLLSDVAQVNAEKQSLEQEITSLRLQLERAERQSKVESSRLNAEIVSLRQRLDRADADLLQSKRENLRLSDQVAALEKEVSWLLNKEDIFKWLIRNLCCCRLLWVIWTGRRDRARS